MLSQEVLAELESEIAELHADKPVGLVFVSGKSHRVHRGRRREGIRPAAERGGRCGAGRAGSGAAQPNRATRLCRPSRPSTDSRSAAGSSSRSRATIGLPSKVTSGRLGPPRGAARHPPGFRRNRAQRAPGRRAARAGLDVHRPLAVSGGGEGLRSRRSRRAEGRARAAARDCVHHDARPPLRRAPWHLNVLNFAPIRPLVARRCVAQVRKRARPRALPCSVRDHRALAALRRVRRRAYRAEAASIGELLVTPTCRNLVRMFELRERLRNLAPQGRERASACTSSAPAPWAATSRRGARCGALTVTLQDRGQQYVDARPRPRGRVVSQTASGARRSRRGAARVSASISPRSRSATPTSSSRRSSRTPRRSGSCSRDLEPRLATASVDRDQHVEHRARRPRAGAQRPGRFVGLHFFNPVASLPLVEVIRGEALPTETLEPRAVVRHADRQAALAVSQRSGFPRQPHPDAIHARSAACARRRSRARDHRRGRESVRHADGSRRARGPRRSRCRVARGKNSVARSFRSHRRACSRRRWPRVSSASRRGAASTPTMRTAERKAAPVSAAGRRARGPPDLAAGQRGGRLPRGQHRRRRGPARCGCRVRHRLSRLLRAGPSTMHGSAVSRPSLRARVPR